MAGEVLVPVSLRPLEEFEIVLHLAFDKRFYWNGAVEAVAGKGIYESVSVVDTTYRGLVLLCKILKFCMYAYSVLTLNLTRPIGISTIAC
jgi:hypothetical protein